MLKYFKIFDCKNKNKFQLNQFSSSAANPCTDKSKKNSEIPDNTKIIIEEDNEIFQKIITS